MNSQQEDKNQTDQEVDIDQSEQASETVKNSPEVDDASAPSEPAEISEELAAAQEEIARLKDAYLRAKAEEDNVRRRSEKEVSNSRKFAIEGFAKEMLQVRDSLKLASAVELAEDADDAVKSIHEGVEITLKQLDAGLAKFSLAEIAPEQGDKLDPNLHQAMSIVESDEVESGHILTVIQVGYQLHERLLRPAMVVVAK